MYIASVFAQLEREVIAERIRDNMIELAKTGRWLGGTTPTGYESEGYTVISVDEQISNEVIEKKSKKAYKLKTIDEEKKIIKIIFDKYEEFKSLTKLETYCLENKIITKNGVAFSRFTLKIILQNPVYCINDVDIYNYFTERDMDIFAEKEEFDGTKGLMAYNKTVSVKGKGDQKRDITEWIISIGLHEGFVTGKQWIQTQIFLKQNHDKRYRVPRRNTALLTGLVRCNECGEYMRVKLSTGRKTKDGDEKFWYICELKEASKGHKCNGKNIFGNVLDKMVLDSVRNLTAPDSEIYKELKEISIKRVDDIEHELKLFKKDYEKNQSEINSLIDRIKYVDVELIVDINNEIKRLKESNAGIEKEISKLEVADVEHKKVKADTVKLILDIVEHHFNIFESLDVLEKRALLRILVESVYGNGEKAVLNLLNSNADVGRKKLYNLDKCGNVNDLLPYSNWCK